MLRTRADLRKRPASILDGKWGHPLQMRMQCNRSFRNASLDAQATKGRGARGETARTPWPHRPTDVNQPADVNGVAPTLALPSFPRNWRSSISEVNSASCDRLTEVEKDANDRDGVCTRLVNQCFVASLWISALFAIWMTRGWIGLFLSRQALSLPLCLFRGLSRGTQFAFATVRTSVGRLEGE